MGGHHRPWAPRASAPSRPHDRSHVGTATPAMSRTAATSRRPPRPRPMAAVTAAAAAPAAAAVGPVSSIPPPPEPSPRCHGRSSSPAHHDAPHPSALTTAPPSHPMRGGHTPPTRPSVAPPGRSSSSSAVTAALSSLDATMVTPTTGATTTTRPDIVLSCSSSPTSRPFAIHPSMPPLHRSNINSRRSGRPAVAARPRRRMSRCPSCAVWAVASNTSMDRRERDGNDDIT